MKKAEGAKREQVMLIRRKLPNGQILEYKVIFLLVTWLVRMIVLISNVVGD